MQFLFKLTFKNYFLSGCACVTLLSKTDNSIKIFIYLFGAGSCNAALAALDTSTRSFELARALLLLLPKYWDFRHALSYLASQLDLKYFLPDSLHVPTSGHPVLILHL